MQANLKAKLLRNLGANAYGQLITVVVQLVSVPLYLHYWGVKLYGEWLILSAVPAYLALCDIGFASVAANDMTIRVAQGDRDGALKVYQSIWLFVSGVSLLVGGILGIIIYAIPVDVIFSISHISTAHTQQVLLLLLFYVLVGLQGGVLSAAFRAAGRYAYGATVSNTVRLTEWAFSAIGLMLGGGVLLIASLMLVIRLIGIVIMWAVLHNQEPWLYLGYRAASAQKVRTLLRPAIAFMAFPLGLALSLQGMVLIIGITLGSAAVAIFSAYRTLTRLLVQLITMLNQSVWPEISAAYGAEKMDLVRQLHRKSSAVTLWIAFFTITIFSLIGQWIINIWTKSAFESNNILLMILLVATFLNVLWQTSWVALMAMNRHERISIAFLLCNFCSLIIAYEALLRVGLIGAGFAMLIAEVPLLVYVVSQSIRLIGEKWSDYLKSLIAFKF